MPRVMIVENSQKPLWLAKKLLASINFEIALDTGNGFEAIEKYNIIKPDFVILDLILSQNEGINVLKEIKRIHQESNVIIITPINNPDQLDECNKLGCYSILTIPFKIQEFLTLVTSSDLKYVKTPTASPVIIDDSN